MRLARLLTMLLTTGCLLTACNTPQKKSANTPTPAPAEQPKSTEAVKSEPTQPAGQPDQSGQFQAYKAKLQTVCQLTDDQLQSLEACRDQLKDKEAELEKQWGPKIAEAKKTLEEIQATDADELEVQSRQIELKQLEIEYNYRRYLATLTSVQKMQQVLTTEQRSKLETYDLQQTIGNNFKRMNIQLSAEQQQQLDNQCRQTVNIYMQAEPEKRPAVAQQQLKTLNEWIGKQLLTDAQQQQAQAWQKAHPAPKP